MGDERLRQTLALTLLTFVLGLVGCSSPSLGSAGARAPMPVLVRLSDEQVSPTMTKQDVMRIMGTAYVSADTVAVASMVWVDCDVTVRFAGEADEYNCPEKYVCEIVIEPRH